METFAYPHFATNVHIGLFTGVKNSAALKKRIINAAKGTGEGDRERNAVNFAFIDARPITSLLHLQSAIYTALVAQSHATLLTRTVHSEILWVLNPSHNITESIKRFGVNDSSQALLLVHISPMEVSADDIKKQMETVVEGEWTPLDCISDLTDWGLVRKYYKLNNDPAIVNVATGQEEELKEVICNIVVSLVAMKSVLA